MLLSLRNRCEQQNRSALRYYFVQEYLAGSLEKRERWVLRGLGFNQVSAVKTQRGADEYRVPGSVLL